MPRGPDPRQGQMQEHIKTTSFHYCASCLRHPPRDTNPLDLRRASTTDQLCTHHGLVARQANREIAVECGNGHGSAPNRPCPTSRRPLPLQRQIQLLFAQMGCVCGSGNRDTRTGQTKCDWSMEREWLQRKGRETERRVKLRAAHQMGLHKTWGELLDCPTDNVFYDIDPH